MSAVIRIFLITRFAADFRALFLALLRIVVDLRRAEIVSNLDAKMLQLNEAILEEKEKEEQKKKEE